MIGRLVAAGERVMQGVEPFPAKSALQLLRRAAFEEKHAKRLAIQGVLSLQLTNGDRR